MGIGLGKRCWTYCEPSVKREPCVWNTSNVSRPEAPDSKQFNIKKMEQVNYNIVVYINYPNCCNYEGNKICVYKNADFSDFVNIHILDPHFSNNTTKISPFARFEPTIEGWNMAVKLAGMI